MALYVLIHGAGSDSWYWHLVAPLLREQGHVVVTPDLPCDDDTAGLEAYADAVLAAVHSAGPAAAAASEVIVVGQSLGGFTAPLVCDRLGATLLVYVAAMIPLPGECGSDWWTNTGCREARSAQAAAAGRAVDAPFDPVYEFFADVPVALVAEVFARPEKGQSDAPFERPWPLPALPDVPTRFVLCTNDRFFPAQFMRRVVRERLGIVPDEIASGHLPAFSHPVELVERLEAFRTEA